MKLTDAEVRADLMAMVRRARDAGMSGRFVLMVPQEAREQAERVMEDEDVEISTGHVQEL